MDFSDESQRALQWAIALAAQHQSQLTVLTAVDPLLANAARARLGLDLRRAETEPALREFVTAVLPASAPWALQPILDARVGDAPDVILEAADRQQADLIVMGTHGLGGVRKLLLGSTTERVLRRTHTSLLAVSIADHLVLVEAAAPRFNVKTILAATDFSETSTGALHWAADLADRLAARLVVAHVVTPVVVPNQWQPYVDLVDDERVTRTRERLETLLADLPNSVRGEAVVTVGPPADSIASIAEERGAGLIVMGLTGHEDQGAFAPRPGSTAYRVVSITHLPVLVVAPPRRAAVTPSSQTSS